MSAGAATDQRGAQPDEDAYLATPERKGTLVGEGHWLAWLDWRWRSPRSNEVRDHLGEDVSRPDVHRSRWLCARAGYSLEDLAELTAGERDLLRRNLSVSAIQPLLWIYYPCTALLAIVTAVQSASKFLDRALLSVLLVTLLAALFMLIWSSWLWATARWGRPDRELGLTVRRILVLQAGLDRKSVADLPGRRGVLLQSRRVSGLLVRAESDPQAVVPLLEAALRKKADPRPICRQMLLDHIRGHLLKVSLPCPTNRPDSLGSTIPKWLTQLATIASALLVLAQASMRG